MKKVYCKNCKWDSGMTSTHCFASKLEAKDSYCAPRSSAEYW